MEAVCKKYLLNKYNINNINVLKLECIGSKISSVFKKNIKFNVGKNFALKFDINKPLICA